MLTTTVSLESPYNLVNKKAHIQQTIYPFYILFPNINFIEMNKFVQKAIKVHNLGCMIILLCPSFLIFPAVGHFPG